MIDIPELNKSPEDLAKDIKVTPEPYKEVKQTCKICGSQLREGESVVCRNCSSQEK